MTVYPVLAGDYMRAGEASGDLKRRLKQLGVTGSVLRRVSVASYEAEMNLVIHSVGGEISFEVSDTAILIETRDRGPGIPDVRMAMREGFSTAPDEAREQGFGAGMGLPNMKRNADAFDIESKVGQGTRVTMTFNLEAT